MNKRIACVLIPDFSLLLGLTENSIRYETPAVLTDNKTRRSKVLFLTTKAVVEGVNLDMTIPQAQAICPGLTILLRNPRKEDKKIKEIIKRLYSISPVVERSDPGIFYLDLSGLKRLYHSEEKIASRTIQEIEGADFPVKVGIAENKFTSFVAAKTCCISNYKIVREGEKMDFLAPYPVQLLPIDQDLLELFFVLGIKTIGKFANLPKEDVLKRYGNDGLKLLKMARGEDPDPIIPFLLKPNESKSVNLDYSLDTETGILFYSQTILKKLLKRISKKGLFCNEFLVKLGLEDSSNVSLHLSVSEGTNNVKVFLKLLKLNLEKLSLSAPVEKVSFSVKKASQMKATQLSFQDQEVLGSLNQLLADSNRIVETQKVLNPEVLKGNSVEDKISNFLRRSMLGLRLFSPPKTVNVIADNGFISCISIDSNFQKVIRQDGPWKIDGQWWDKPFERKYYEVGLNKGEKYLIFCDLKSGKWFLEGVFD